MLHTSHTTHGSPTAAPGVPALRLHGHPRVEGTPRPLTLRHGLALLARLAESRVPLGRDGLAPLLWPDAPLATARSRLRRLVHQVHEQTGSLLVAADGDTLRLADGVRCDLHATRVTMSALATLTAPAAGPGIDPERVAPLLAPEVAGFLDGFTLGSDAFDDWAQQVRSLHQSTLAQALSQAADQALASVDGADPLLATAIALAAADALLRLDPCHEAAHATRIGARALQGDAAAVESAYLACAAVLREELGVRPSALVEQAYARALAALREQQPEIRWAPAPGDAGDGGDDGGGHVAHVAWGRGPRTVVALWGLMSHVEVALEEPRAKGFLDQLARHNRVVMLDRRGTGLSERIGTTPGLESGAQDILATLNHLGVQRAWLFGSAVGGTQALDFALRHPGRVAGLILYGTSAVGRRHSDAPWGLADADVQPWLQSLTDPAHYRRSLRCFAPSVADDPAVQRWYARLLRHAGTPRAVAAMLMALRDVDLRTQLHRVQVPTLVLHRRGDRLVPLAAGRQIAAAVPRAEITVLDGDDHFLWYGDSAAVLAAVQAFLAREGRGVLPLAA